MVSSKEEFGAQHRMMMQESRDKETLYRTELGKAHTMIAGLEDDLSACKGTIDAANEAILLKVSMIYIIGEKRFKLPEF